jgi:hypothetical protein
VKGVSERNPIVHNPGDCEHQTSAAFAKPKLTGISQTFTRTKFLANALHYSVAHLLGNSLGIAVARLDLADKQ